MKANNSEKRILKKNILAAVLIAGVGTLVFQGLTQIAMANETGKTDIVPTTYTAVAAASTNPEPDSPPEGYTKADYTVRIIDLPAYRNRTPDAKDLTKEEAAEIGVQALWEVFGVDMEGQVVEMGYDVPTEDQPRSQWFGSVLIDGVRCYYFYLDSVTGEVGSIGHSRTLDVDVPLGFDSALAKNPGEYIALAREVAEKHDAVHSDIASVEYYCQGYSNNDPDIMIAVTGENGEMVQIGFSRYDQALLGIAYHFEEMLQNEEELEEELAEKYSNWTPPDDGGSPSLVTMD